MKIMFTINSLAMGGAESLITDYMIKLQQLGYTVVLLELYKDDTILVKRLKQNGIKLLQLCRYHKGSKILRKIGYYILPYLARFKANRAIKSEKPDVIHVNGSIDWLCGINFPAKRMFYTFHTDIEREFGMRSILHRKTLLKKAAEGMSVFVLNKKMLKDADKIIGTENIYYIPNGLDIEYIRKNALPKKEAKKRMEIPCDAFVVGHVGRIHPVKNHEKLIEIFEEIKKINASAYLVLIGEGEKRYMDKIKGIIDEHGLGERIRFMGLREDAVALMGGFDVFILPSFNEGFPLVTIEAQAQQIRTILSSAVSDAVVCNRNCFKLNICEEAKVWAEYAVGDFLSQTERNIVEYDINAVLGRLTAYYQAAVDGKQIGALYDCTFYK